MTDDTWTIGQELTIVCQACGKKTAGGRLPREGRHHPGDGTFRFPRRHRLEKQGPWCDGSFMEGEWLPGSRYKDET